MRTVYLRPGSFTGLLCEFIPIAAGRQCTRIRNAQYAIRNTQPASNAQYAIRIRNTQYATPSKVVTLRIICTARLRVLAYCVLRMRIAYQSRSISPSASSPPSSPPAPPPLCTIAPPPPRTPLSSPAHPSLFSLVCISLSETEYPERDSIIEEANRVPDPYYWLGNFGGLWR